MKPHNPAKSQLHTVLTETSNFLRQRMGDRRPLVGLVLGSGLGAFAETFEDAVAIDYSEVPHFVESTVSGHAGRYVIGTRDGVTCMAMQGRVHYYEGYTAAQVAFPVRVMIELGADTIIVTNAAGSLESTWTPGTLMLISDHINLTGANPLTGPNDAHVGPRFPDMTEAYDRTLRDMARAAAERLDIRLEEGVYAGLAGPTYETPAEIRMVRAVGGHAVGMSTVFEVIVARHMGARVLGVSCITNLAAGLQGEPLHHGEVKIAAERARASFQSLLSAVITTIGETAAHASDDDDDAAQEHATDVVARPGDPGDPGKGRTES